MSENQVADAQDATTAASEEKSSSVADTTQRNPQGDKVPAASADEVDYQAQRDAFLKDEKKFLEENGEAEASQKTGETIEVAESEEKETPEADATEETETTTPEVTKPNEESEDAEEPASDSAILKRKHVNLARMGEDKSKLVLFLDQNPGVTLSKAIEILGLQLTENQAEEAVSKLPSTIEGVETLIKTKRAERKKAFGEDLDFKLAAELDEEIEALRDHSLSLREKETSVRNEKANQFNTELSKSKQNAVAYYPDCAKADSQLVKKMIEIDALLDETGDERFHSPDKPFIVAKLAAKELGIAPRDPNAPATPVKSTSPAPAKVPVSPVQPAPGNRRTQQTKTQEGTLEEMVDKVQSEDDYEALKAKVLAGV